MDDKKIEEIINKAASNAAQLVKEQMQSQFRVFGEGLEAVRDKVNSIDARTTRIEDRVDVIEILAKNTYKELQKVNQIVSVHEKKLTKV
ncbi:MAG: hypothetical protein AABZ14_00885 [Candidatus Margulisiibacteriota bacterium]